MRCMTFNGTRSPSRARQRRGDRYAVVLGARLRAIRRGRVQSTGAAGRRLHQEHERDSFVFFSSVTVARAAHGCVLLLERSAYYEKLCLNHSARPGNCRPSQSESASICHRERRHGACHSESHRSAREDGCHRETIACLPRAVRWRARATDRRPLLRSGAASGIGTAACQGL